MPGPGAHRAGASLRSGREAVSSKAHHWPQPPGVRHTRPHRPRQKGSHRLCGVRAPRPAQGWARLSPSPRAAGLGTREQCIRLSPPPTHHPVREKPVQSGRGREKRCRGSASLPLLVPAQSVTVATRSAEKAWPRRGAVCARARAQPQSPRDFCASCLATRQNCSRSSRHILEASTLAPLSSLGSASMLTTDSRIFSTLCTGLHRSALLS